LFGISEDLPNNFFVSLVKLLKIYFSEGIFDSALYNSLIKDFELNKKEISPNPNHKFRMYYLIHYVKGLKAIVEDNQEEFEIELHQCLSKFKEVWSQKKSLNVGGFPFLRDEQGFISFEGTVLMVLAKKKEWEVSFESGYILSEKLIDSRIHH
jgi:methionine synthase II (cobalamin-independent)